MYPSDWPRCPTCDDYALDGHITCGRWECDESGHRKRRTDEWRRVNSAEMQRNFDRLYRR